MRTYKPNTCRKFAFTKRAIESLPPHDPASPSREAEYSDAECTGLRLRVSKNGRRFFQHRYNFLGRKQCISLGEFPAVSVQDARLRVNEHKALLARDKDPAAERGKVRDDLTFEDFARQHYLPYAQAHKQTWENDRTQIEKRLNPVLGKLRLHAITARDVSLVHAKEKERTTACTANHLLTTLKRMLNLAVKWGMLEKNPASGQEKFKEKPLQEKYLSKDQLSRFLKALNEGDDHLSVAAIRLLLFTGCRRGEIVSLRWEQLNLEEDRIFLLETKNGRSRTVHLNTKAKEVLEELSAQRDHVSRTRDSEFVFPSRQGTKKGHLFDLRNPFEKACKLAGIEGLHLHSLRHSFASLAVMSGASLYDVQKLLGHQDPKMTQRYAHLDAASLKRATEGVSDIIDKAV